MPVDSLKNAARNLQAKIRAISACRLLAICITRGIDGSRNAHDALYRIRRGIDNGTRRINNLGIEQNRCAAARLHSMRSGRNASKNARLGKALV